MRWGNSPVVLVDQFAVLILLLLHGTEAVYGGPAIYAIADLVARTLVILQIGFSIRARA